ncbi:CRISPR-associated protein, Csn1 family [Streptococcus troglodytae]|uniref:CRISPR-associated protein, Csn1 family n=1 Tax=Streptococcus troglodytae TaxID=1111760 RepID=A0A1L7LIE3_9STRE|nr:CRISPR-associated protein, Csn1 family [Streptococcus troglodytae]
MLGKIKDIYSQAGYDTFRKKYDKDKAVFLMYQKDPETWEKVIEVILRDYKELDDKGKEIGNPFERYKVKNGFVRKYSRKNKGTEIKSLKYYDNKLGNHIDITPDNSKHSVVLQSINPWRADLYFNPETTKYELMGLKYADLSFEKGTGNYSISQEKYDEIKEREGISSTSEFKFTLYKNDLILVKDIEAGRKLNFDKNKEIEFQQLFRFLSRTMPNQKHYAELKPYDKAKFDGGQPLLTIFGNVAKGGQCLKSLNKFNISIYKVKTDILGHKYYIKKKVTNLNLILRIKSKISSKRGCNIFVNAI